MGRRGPARTPTKVLALSGSWRAKSRTDEPPADGKTPICPAWLGKHAKTTWRYIVPRLADMGVLGSTDRNTLARYCQLFVRWREAEASGDVTLSIKLSAHLLKLEREFGLTPSARAGLAKPKDNPHENRGKNRFFQKAAGA